jgi:hypothetical protein
MAGRISAIPIFTPLPHVSVHVVKPKGVRRLATHWMRSLAGVSTIPSYGIQSGNETAACLPYHP